MPEADLYDGLIMEHIRNARNYRVPERARLRETGSNPLCGDELTLYLEMRRGRIEDIAFQCTCCGISMASASIMTGMMKGRERADAARRIRAFLALASGRGGRARRGATREQRAILETVRKFPSRARCATLAWSTLASALEERREAASLR
jgi:nitrogen fixation NifU-like protein